MAINPARFWLNSETNLFWLKDDCQPIWLKGACIEKIFWKETERARVLIWASLPGGKDALKIKDGHQLELLHRDCGPRGEYFPEESIMLFRNIKLRRKWIPKPVVLDPNNQDEIGIYISLECELTLRL